jgi:hypothetical protein
LGLLPIEWVKREPKILSRIGPGGASRPGQDSIGGKTLELLCGCLASARHLSPTLLRKAESWVKSGQPKYFPTRTDETPAASLCPAMGGMRPLGPSQILPTLAASIPADGKSTEIAPPRLGEDPELFFLMNRSARRKEFSYRKRRRRRGIEGH